MATRLQTFVTAVAAELVTAGITDVEHRVSRTALSLHGVKRRVVWMSPGGKLVPPDQAGGRTPGSGAAERSPACKTNDAEVHAYIYGGNGEATEQLFEAVVSAACKVGAPRIEMPRYDWVTQEEERAGNALRTECIRVVMTMHWPILEEIKALREVLSVDDVCGTLAGTETDWTITPHG